MSTDRRPAVSVLLPTYNQARFLPDALAGIAAQTFQDFELIVCDDGSTDDTGDIVRDFGFSPGGICYVPHETNRGTAAAINTAAEYATGRHRTWVSSDNVMHPHWLDKLVAYLESRPRARAVYSPYNRLDQFPDSGKTRPRLVAPGPYDPGRLVGSLECYFGPSFLVRGEAWLPHRDGLAHDYDWWLRFEETTAEIGYYPDPLCDYRMGPWQTGRNKPQALIADAKRRQAEAKERRAKCASMSTVSNAQPRHQM